jgi:hypothetical protein
MLSLHPFRALHKPAQGNREVIDNPITVVMPYSHLTNGTGYPDVGFILIVNSHINMYVQYYRYKCSTVEHYRKMFAFARPGWVSGARPSVAFCARVGG